MFFYFIFTVSVTLFNNKPEFQEISSFDIINVVIFPDPNIFLCIPTSAVDVAAGNPKGIKTLLANGLITFLY